MKGLLKLNTPVCVIKDGNIIKLGVITNIEESRKSVNVAKKGAKVAVKISNEETNIIYNRHFSINDSIYSVVTRKSIDTLKQYFKDELDEDQIQLLFYLKRVFDII
ncbi:IF2P [Hepatospora eriocheir]|uniref:IF2P n=1 Tax=Hepatospora eriocheir TaxID=1081669 RepID=A0A1X0Q7U2_9MICR|nr:IF2P [Hepatospora eriocheir]ORD98339.1 IF2P [Hepatospora eriocheir]